jgi:hypothetical protein
MRSARSSGELAERMEEVKNAVLICSAGLVALVAWDCLTGDELRPAETATDDPGEALLGCAGRVSHPCARKAPRLPCRSPVSRRMDAEALLPVMSTDMTRTLLQLPA